MNTRALASSGIAYGRREDLYVISRMQQAPSTVRKRIFEAFFFFECGGVNLLGGGLCCRQRSAFARGSRWRELQDPANPGNVDPHSFGAVGSLQMRWGLPCLALCCCEHVVWSSRQGTRGGGQCAADNQTVSMSLGIGDMSECLAVMSTLGHHTAHNDIPSSLMLHFTGALSSSHFCDT